MGTKDDKIKKKKLESDVNATEWTKIHSIQKTTIIDVKEQKHNMENYLKHVVITLMLTTIEKS